MAHVSSIAELAIKEDPSVTREVPFEVGEGQAGDPPEVRINTDMELISFY